DLMADGGLRDVQLCRRLGEAEVACGSLEGSECIQRRQAHGFRITSANPKHEETSFVEEDQADDSSWRQTFRAGWRWQWRWHRAGMKAAACAAQSASSPKASRS